MKNLKATSLFLLLCGTLLRGMQDESSDLELLANQIHTHQIELTTQEILAFSQQLSSYLLPRLQWLKEQNYRSAVQDNISRLLNLVGRPQNNTVLLDALIENFNSQDRDFNFLEFFIAQIKGEQRLYEELVRLVRQKVNVNARNKDNQTPLHVVSISGYMNVAKIIILAGGDVDARDDRGRTPLHVATDFGKVSLIYLLLAAKADVDAQDHEGKTALFYANKIEVLKALIEARAALDIHSLESAHTPLHDATINGDVDLVEMLIEARAPINAVDNSGLTPLHWAAIHGHGKVADILIICGAIINARDNDGKKPLDLAVKTNQQILSLLNKKIIPARERPALITTMPSAPKNIVASGLRLTGHPAEIRTKLKTD